MNDSRDDHTPDLLDASLGGRLDDVKAAWQQDNERIANLVLEQIDSAPAGAPKVVESSRASIVRLPVAGLGMAAGFLLAVVLWSFLEHQEPAVRWTWKLALQSQGAGVDPGLPTSFELLPGVSVKAGSDTLLEVANDEGVQLRLQRDTDAVLEDTHWVRLRDGQVWARVPRSRSSEAAAPYTIETPQTLVTGTVFEIDVFTSTELTTITVFSGSVSVANGSRAEALRAGQQLVLTPQQWESPRNFYFPEKFRGWTYELLALPEADPAERHEVIRRLVLGLEDSEEGRWHAELLRTNFAPWAPTELLAFFETSQPYAPAGTQELALQLLAETLDPEPVPEVVDQLFRLLGDQEGTASERGVTVRLFELVEQASGVKLMPVSNWLKIDNSDERNMLLKKWREVWRFENKLPDEKPAPANDT